MLHLNLIATGVKVTYIIVVLNHVALIFLMGTIEATPGIPFDRGDSFTSTGEF